MRAAKLGARAGGQASVCVVGGWRIVSRRVTCLRRVLHPGSGRRCPSCSRTARRQSGRPSVGSGGAGWLGAPSNRAAPFLKPPSPAVDRLLVKWSLASSAPNRVEVSMMRKFCDTGVRKRLADTGGRGGAARSGRRFKGTVGPSSPFFSPAPELRGLERRIILNVGVRCCRCLATWLLPASSGTRWRFR